jgi:hypothetical protein
MKLSSGKLQFWELKKPPADAGTFCPSPILLFFIPSCCKCLPVWSLEPDFLHAVKGKFRKNLRTELSGKTAGDFTAWGGKPRT